MQETIRLATKPRTIALAIRETSSSSEPKARRPITGFAARGCGYRRAGGNRGSRPRRAIPSPSLRPPGKPHFGEYDLAEDLGRIGKMREGFAEALHAAALVIHGKEEREVVSRLRPRVSWMRGAQFRQQSRRSRNCARNRITPPGWYSSRNCAEVGCSSSVPGSTHHEHLRELALRCSAIVWPFYSSPAPWLECPALSSSAAGFFLREIPRWAPLCA